MAVGLSYLVALFYKKKFKHLVTDDEKRATPPRIKLGLIENIKMMISGHYPWLLFNETKKIKSHIFQLNLAPVFGVPMVVVVGESKLARDIFLDPHSTKPL